MTSFSGYFNRTYDIAISENETEVLSVNYKCPDDIGHLVPGESRLVVEWKGCVKSIVYPKCGGTIKADDCKACNVTFKYDNVSIVRVWV